MIKTNRSGFTIVELLIVIVVIGILAAITIVAYNGIQNRANDTAVMSDLRSLAMKLQEHKAVRDVLPRGTTSSSALDGFDQFAASKSAYATDVHNLYYCRGIVGGAERFSLVAQSKSGKRWMYQSAGGLSEFTSAMGSSGSACDATNVPRGSSDFTYSYGLFANGAWSGWIK